MAHPLDACLEKIKRANHHIRQIHELIQKGGFAPNDAVRAKYKRVTRRGPAPSAEHTAIFRLSGDPPALPMDLAIFAGEAAHQLRSTLDHLVYQLIVVKTKQPPTFPSAFPVIWYPRKGRTTLLEEYEAQTSRLKQDITVSAETIIRGLQPFHRLSGFDDDPLWVLNELDNVDKHRLLLVTVVGVSLYQVSITARDKTIKASFTPNIRFENDAEIGTVPLDDLLPFEHEKMGVYGDLVVNVAFDQIGRRKNVTVIPCLAQLSSYVRSVIESFKPEF